MFTCWLSKTILHRFKRAALLHPLATTIDWLLLRNCFRMHDSLHDNNYISRNTIRQLFINNFNSDTKKPHTTFACHFIVKTELTIKLIERLIISLKFTLWVLHYIKYAERRMAKAMQCKISVTTCKQITRHLRYQITSLGVTCFWPQKHMSTFACTTFVEGLYWPNEWRK